MLTRIGAAILATVAVGAILTLLLGPVTSWAGGSAVRHLSGKEKADAINGVRHTLLQAAAGSIALAVLVFTGLTFGLNRRGQVTDRYTKAIGLLASEKLDERIGGIYALEHVMIESERDHETVVQVLAAFVREHAAIDATRPRLWIDPPPRQRDSQASGKSQPAADIQAALTVLGRRPTRNENQPLDLRRSNLHGANLCEAYLKNANLRGVNLENANLIEANLESANLHEAHLKYTNLRDAHLEEACLNAAHLEGANLRWTQLKRADLMKAHLEEACLDAAHLEGADLSKAHLKHADLIETHLEDADLIETHLEGANLTGAHLKSARLFKAHLEGASLIRAHLEGANLIEAHLEEAYLSGAHLKNGELRGAHLEGANLSGIENLKESQIEHAIVNARTVLPSYLTPKQGDSSSTRSSA